MSMKEYAEYLTTLDDLIADVMKRPFNPGIIGRIDEVLNGQPSDALRRLVPREKLVQRPFMGIAILDDWTNMYFESLTNTIFVAL